MKSLLPTLKTRKRYIAFEIIPINSEKIYSRNPYKEFITQIRTKMGILEASKADIMPVQYDTEKRKGIIKVNHNYADKAKAAFLFIQEIGTTQVIPRTLGVSGTLKKTRQKYIN